MYERRLSLGYRNVSAKADMIIYPTAKLLALLKLIEKEGIVEAQNVGPFPPCLAVRGLEFAQRVNKLSCTSQLRI